MPPEQTNSEQNVLSPDYYLTNFVTLLEYVQEQYTNLLHPEEVGFVDGFKSLSLNSQRLFVRLISRKGPCFRTDKLNYNEIENIEKSTYELKEQGFIAENLKEDLESVLHTITRPELIGLFREGDLPDPPENYKSATKPFLVGYILSMEESIVWENLENKWTFIFPLHYDKASLFFLLFFGNLEQTLSDFILEDIGVLRYEQYKIRKEDRLFNDRKVIDGYIEIYNLRVLLWNAVEQDDLEQVQILGLLFKEINPPVELLRKVEKSYNEIGRFLEKFHRWDEALSYYELSALTPSRERRARILDKIGLVSESLDLTNQILEDPANEEESEFAIHFSEKLKKKLELPYKSKLREKFGETELIIEKIPGEKIEGTVMNHFISENKQGFNSENGIWTALFGLVFWDVIFMSVPGVFFNPYQRGPADLHTPGFYEKRKDTILETLEEYKRDQNWQEKLLARYDEKKDTANFMVPWKRVDREQVQLVLEWIPKRDILIILERMAGRLREFRSGFPDLIVYDSSVKQYSLIEVKGPGDQLRPNQRRWLHFFSENDIPYSVARVKWEG